MEKLNESEIAASVCELNDIAVDEIRDFDIVVVGAGASGVPAAGWAAELGAKVPASHAFIAFIR